MTRVRVTCTPVDECSKIIQVLILQQNKLKIDEIKETITIKSFRVYSIA